MRNSANINVIKLSDGRQVCLSYGVIVAAYIPPAYGDKLLGSTPLGPLHGYVRTVRRYSVTTTRHMNSFAGKDARSVAHSFLLDLCKPVTSRL